MADDPEKDVKVETDEGHEDPATEPGVADESEVQIPLGAIACIGFATLLFEILLTRIFSLTMWYHFAFVAISLALFGIAASGVAVSMLSVVFTKKRALNHMAKASLLLGVAIPVAFIIDLNVPFLPFESKFAEKQGMPYLPHALFFLKFMVLSVPFFLSGLTIALAFTHAATTVTRTYFADLVGGGLGCLVSVILLLTLSGPSAIILTAAFAFVAAALFYRASGSRRGFAVGLVAATLVVGATWKNEVDPTITIERIKSYKKDLGQTPEKKKAYEGWHPVSRVAVYTRKASGTQHKWFYAKGAGVKLPPLMEVTNDGGAKTFIWKKISQERAKSIFEKDVSDHAYKLVDSPKVLVVGVGGGKDILSGLALGAESVRGVELNPLMKHVVQERFGDFSGRPYDDPRAEVVIDEARNHVASHDELYDIIKVSVTDTWAASAGGAYALTESYLYTEEALEDFLGHLEPGGYLTITRWYPQETFRLISLTMETLRKMGVEHPERRMAMFRNRGTTATLLIKNGDLTPEDEQKLIDGTKAAMHPLIYLPNYTEYKQGKSKVLKADAAHRRILTEESLDAIEADLGVQLDPPTDDRPFFFNIVSLSQAKEGDYAANFGFRLQHGRAQKLLLGMLWISSIVALVFVIGPLLLGTSSDSSVGRVSLVSRLGVNIYFLSLGLGFLLVEIPLLQQFILYVGHPTYAVTLVLFSLLVGSGTGSYLAGRYHLPKHPKLRYLYLAIVVAILASATVLGPFLRLTIGLPFAMRIIVAILVLGPLGLLLGMPFPVGVTAVHKHSSGLVPWAWAINGAASVAAPVLAMVVAILWGFSTALLLGAACYALAAASSMFFFHKLGEPS